MRTGYSSARPEPVVRCAGAWQVRFNASEYQRPAEEGREPTTEWRFDYLTLAEYDPAGAASAVIQAILDSAAQARRWDDIKSARAAAGVALPADASAAETAIHQEATALARWDRACWAKSLEIEAAVKEGLRPIPTPAEVAEELPPLENYL